MQLNETQSTNKNVRPTKKKLNVRPNETKKKKEVLVKNSIIERFVANGEHKHTFQIALKFYVAHIFASL